MNHYVIQKDIFCKLEQLKTSNNSWTWAAHDISDEKPETEKFCTKFTSKEQYQRFEVEFNKAISINAETLRKNEEKAVQKEPEAKVEETK